MTPLDQPERQCTTCGENFPASFAVCPHDATPLIDGSGGADALIGAVLAGTYRITGVLGEGGMARLYEAEHLRVDARYAIKVIHDDLAKNAELLTRFRREAKAAAKIRSPHIVTVIDVLQTPDGRPCIVTELLEGEDLQQRLDRLGKASPKKAIPIARQICKALIAAHECGVIHRDLKPSNVFLCNEGGETMVKVLDFGVAKLDGSSELTKTGAIVGTLAYMAPEQAVRASDAGPLADVYQVGAVLYHMLTGEPPYGKDPAVNPLVLLLGGPPKPAREIEPSIPIGIEAVIGRAMARDPSERPGSAAELNATLAAFSRERASDKSSRATEAADDSERDDETPLESGPAALEIARQASRARPSALMLACASTVTVGLFAASLLGSLLASAASADSGSTTSERTLIALLAIVASAVIGAALARTLHANWRDIPAIRRLNRVLARGLLAGLVAFGALELISLAFAAISADVVGLVSGWSFRLGVSGVVAIAAVIAPRIGALRRLL